MSGGMAPAVSGMGVLLQGDGSGGGLSNKSAMSALDIFCAITIST